MGSFSSILSWSRRISISGVVGEIAIMNPWVLDLFHGKFAIWPRRWLWRWEIRRGKARRKKRILEHVYSGGCIIRMHTHSGECIAGFFDQASLGTARFLPSNITGYDQDAAFWVQNMIDRVRIVRYAEHINRVLVLWNAKTPRASMALRWYVYPHDGFYKRNQ